ncbi:HNH endonuclease domain-containing protein [Archangium sp.]|uniref:HNH endonuclease domain-containing protein n=1 Tax=Archangium sp. TaxID=1872627 RepID=UPI00286D6698|nr:HNH endonuclease domain-containing protein [Archangium sp.]
MKKLNRESLSVATLAVLEERTQQVIGAADPKAEAQRLWKQQDNKAFEEARATLESMATGLHRCMYCEDSAATDIEHFWPKSRYPDKAFTWANYLLACSCCNSNHKREQFPLDATGTPLLLDPTAEEPREHLHLSGATGKYVPLTLKGEKSIEVFGLGRDILEKGRKNAWRALQALLVHYRDACQRGDEKEAQAIKHAVLEYPFASVFTWVVAIAESAEAARFIHPHCLDVLNQYPDIKSWL